MIEYGNPRTSDPPAAPGSSWLRSALMEMVWIILGAALVAAVGFFVALVMAPAVGYLAPLAIILVLVAMAMLVRSLRRGRAMAAVNYLEQAARLNLPLPAMLIAAEQAERGKLRGMLVRLRNAIEDGAPVGAALRRSIPGTPPRIGALLTAGERMGRLPQTLRRLVTEPRPSFQQNPANAIFIRWYPIAMLMCLGPVGAIIGIFVVPKFQRIFADFHLPLPKITQRVLSVWQGIEVPLTMLGILVVVVFCGRMLSQWAPMIRSAMNPWQSLVDRIVWITPVWGSIVRSRSMADLCNVLADALEAGQPLAAALEESIEACTNAVLRRRVRRWGEAVAAGAAIDDAARRARMPALLAGMLATTRQSSDAGDVFRFLARYYDGRFSAAAALLQASAIPVMVLVTALFVGSLAVGLFMPMAELMNRLPVTRGVL